MFGSLVISREGGRGRTGMEKAEMRNGPLTEKRKETRDKRKTRGGSLPTWRQEWSHTHPKDGVAAWPGQD